MPLNELLLCAAFTEDGIPKRPTHQPPRRIRVTKRRESSPKKKRPPRGPQPPVTMSTVFEGPSLPAAQSTISLSQPQPERRRGTYCPQDAIEPAQRYITHISMGANRNSCNRRHRYKRKARKAPFQPTVHAMVGNMGRETPSATGQMRRRWECRLSRCRHSNSNRSHELALYCILLTFGSV